MVTDEIRAAIGALGARWSIEEPDLVLRLDGPMTRTGEVAAYAGKLADEVDHHPDIALAYRGLTLRIHTHDAKAITDQDVTYARRLEDWLRAHGW